VPDDGTHEFLAPDAVRRGGEDGTDEVEPEKRSQKAEGQPEEAVLAVYNERDAGDGGGDDREDRAASMQGP